MRKIMSRNQKNLYLYRLKTNMLINAIKNPIIILFIAIIFPYICYILKLIIMELRLNIDDDFMKKMKELLKETKNKKLTEDAFTLLSWAANETKNGRVIISANKEGKDVKELAMPSLEKLKTQ